MKVCLWQINFIPQLPRDFPGASCEENTLFRLFSASETYMLGVRQRFKGACIPSHTIAISRILESMPTHHNKLEYDAFVSLVSHYYVKGFDHSASRIKGKPKIRLGRSHLSIPYAEAKAHITISIPPYIQQRAQAMPFSLIYRPKSFLFLGWYSVSNLTTQAISAKTPISERGLPIS